MMYESYAEYIANVESTFVDSMFSFEENKTSSSKEYTYVPYEDDEIVEIDTEDFDLPF